MRRTGTFSAIAAVMMLASAFPAAGRGFQTGQRAVVPRADEDAVAELQKGLNEYVQLRDRATASLTPVPKDATPEQIDLNQRQTIQAITRARANAKPGAIFRPVVQDYVRRQLMEVFSRPDGNLARASILDENPIGTAVRINGPYPDGIPLASMPPQVLEALPKLPQDLEYRFVGDRLILFDNHAHLIVDYIDGALPKA